MNLKKGNNTARELKSKSNNKSQNKKSIDKFDNPMKVYEYQNRVHMIQKKINQKVKEEQKNIEKNLSKLTTHFHNLTTRNFYRDYQKYSDKYFKTTNLIENIAEKYQEKGYIIPNLNHDFFKVNPLLDSSVNKLFISYLFDRKNGEKIDYDELYRKNKGIKYIKKLKNFISPEDCEKKEKKGKKNKSKKYKKKRKNNSISKEKFGKSDNGLINLRDIHDYHIKTETSNKKINSSKNIKIHIKNNNKTSISLFNKNDKNKINRSKSINYPSTIVHTERNNNKYDSFKVNIKNKNEIYLNLPKEKNKVRNSTNNLTFLSTFNFINNIKTSLNSNKLYLNTEKKLTEKTDDNTLDTPKNKAGNKISSSNHDKSSNTKPFSSNNTELNFSSSHKYQTSKTNNLLLSFKIKEFSVNSKKEKNSIDSKKIKINDYTSKNISYPKISRYSYSYKNNPIANTKISPITKNEEKVTISSKKINLSEKKDNTINKIYKQLKAGKYENIENKMRIYLSKTKKMNEREVECCIKKYEYKNLKSNFNELKKYINEKKLSKKIERIYLNNHDYNRIEPLMNLLNNKEKEIFRFDNKISNIYSKS